MHCISVQLQERKNHEFEVVSGLLAYLDTFGSGRDGGRGEIGVKGKKKENGETEKRDCH